MDGGKLFRLYDQAVEEHGRCLGLGGSPERQASLFNRLELLIMIRRRYSHRRAEGFLTLDKLRERLAEIEKETE